MDAVTETKELLYLYGFIPSKEVDSLPLESFSGLDGEHLAYTKSFGDITCVLCKLEENEYGEKELEERMQDPKWLQEKAFHHHEALVKINDQYTAIPLKFGTIFKSETRLKETIDDQRDTVLALFSSLQNKEEWNVKIYCAEEALKEEVMNSSPEMEAKRKEIELLPSGRQFFEKKKLQKYADELLENEMDKRSKAIHDELSSLSSKAAVKKNLSKDVTGRKEAMAWNSVYLIEKEKVNNFLRRIQDMNSAAEKQGFFIEVTGPWPTYYFANL